MAACHQTTFGMHDVLDLAFPARTSLRGPLMDRQSSGSYTTGQLSKNYGTAPAIDIANSCCATPHGVLALCG